MLFIHLTNILPGRPTVIGPAPWFQLCGGQIRRGPDGKVIAEHVKDAWHAGGQYFISMVIRDRACVHPEDPKGESGEPWGPFNGLVIANGTVRANDALYARFLQSNGLWHCLETAQYWPVLTFKPARD
jgi:hypothetical protein